MAGPSRLLEVLEKYQGELLADWVTEQRALAGADPGAVKEPELRAECAEFLRLLVDAALAGEPGDLSGPAWMPVSDFLADLSRRRGQQGATPSETAAFVLSLKRPVFERLRRDAASDGLFDEIWSATQLLDRLGLYTTELHQKAREEVIARQSEEMLELSTPVVKLWDGILALPMIGTLDSNRTQVVMEALLQKIVETGSQVAIIDITGVPTVDTLVAQHLLKTVAAARLMGAECIISGIRPQIAQTIVHLAIDLGDVSTKATLADAFALALTRSGRRVTAAP
ncbi:MAG TPA: STAS domain-containing protein [Anaeromyxobacteraceae bacterium]|jgi:rsbT co-antagonist protein RsbR|nr:STAS domain-containing protein [Anaeromyxobacteraceae bacterium]